MSRSKWKIPYISNIFFTLFSNKKQIFNVWTRNSVISPILVNRSFRVHNGVWFLTISINLNMVGYKFGEFSITKKLNNRKILYKKRKKKNN